MSLTDDDIVLAHAYVDGEIDALQARAFEGRLAGEPALAAEVTRVRQLQAFLRARPVEAPSDLLRRKIDLVVRRENRAFRTQSPVNAMRPIASVAASLLLAAGLFWGILIWPGLRSGEAPLLDALVASHIRAQISGQPFDIASADRHTVKPWLAARLPISPMVVDLAAEGFPLAGGRIDVVNLQPVATLVFRRSEHFISVMELPARDLPTSGALAGYNIASWKSGAVEYVAISDIQASELAAFVKLFQSAAAAQ